jgi:hypothetical protein
MLGKPLRKVFGNGFGALNNGFLALLKV